MAENQETQKQSDWKSKREINKEKSSETDGISGNETSGESSWRPADNDGEQKEPTENPTGVADKSPAS